MPAKGWLFSPPLALKLVQPSVKGGIKSSRGKFGAAAGRRKLHLLVVALLLGLCAHVIHADDPVVTVLVPGEVVEGALASKVHWSGQARKVWGLEGRKSSLACKVFDSTPLSPHCLSGIASTRPDTSF